MTDRIVKMNYHRLPIVSAVLAAVWMVGYYAVASPSNWWIQRETVIVEKTVWQMPWYVDAAGPAAVIFMLGVIAWGMAGGFPRP